jgi:hypothetical protein
MVRTGQTFALVAEEYLDYLAHDRQRKPTLRDARSVLRNHLLPIFGPRQVEDISVDDVDGRSPNDRRGQTAAMPSGVVATRRRAGGAPHGSYGL